MTGELESRIRAELGAPLPSVTRTVAAELAKIGGAGTLAVLHYGSAMRTKDAEGVLDFYVLVDDLKAWPGRPLAAAAGAVLPPNVERREIEAGRRVVPAKVAILSLAQFERMVSGAGVDTTVWARFCQPAALAWRRDEAAEQAVVSAIGQAVVTAARWAAMLGPAQGPAEAFWTALFRQTYAAELRVERAGREATLMAFAEDRYRTLTPLAWARAGVAYRTEGDGILRPLIGAAERRRLRLAWAMKRRLGRPLNVLRLIKAVFTFQGAFRYAAWKIERHTGVRIEVTPWKERHPVLAAPGVLWRLSREGVFRRSAAPAGQAPAGQAPLPRSQG